MKENSIEEDMKRIEYIFEFQNKMSCQYVLETEDGKAIKHILSDYKRVLKENEQKDKIIDLMLNEITNDTINTCPLEDYNYDLDCENKCNDNYKECWKKYFENKAKEEK